MDNMVERVARAISGAPFPSKQSMAKARAAIKAMRIPTEAMELAGDDHADRGAVVWISMIDAALKESNND